MRASEQIRDADDLHHTLCCQRHSDHTCTSAELCWTCRIALLTSCRTLAANLAIGAALCAAFYEGFGEGFNASGEGFNGDYAPRLTDEKFTAMAQDAALGNAYGATWKPGCGEPTPTASKGAGR